jgi:hypothetical protein
MTPGGMSDLHRDDFRAPMQSLSVNPRLKEAHDEH